ncbi:protein kinase [Candidatus Chloroploca sp. M-50]|uniref:Protein kinase n=1 Tax=Candidatus Chloroploca mongolica TaxID=2528176 RepID=A0ABS4D4R9_9CHLR|nr:protein kinase [Candidatus Chloroploca mongolica]MBP1464430.1 protein kinase [Candidatus Chloroploca mongolica]
MSGSDSGLPVQQVLSWTIYLLDTLAQLHRLGMTHRDVKPQNIILHARTGLPYLIDFGLAKAQGSTRILGYSPGFAAPEQLPPPQPTSPATDVYAVGVLLFTMLMGIHNEDQIPPPQADERYRRTIEAALRSHPYVDEALVMLVSRAVAYEQTDRFPDAGAMLAALRPLCLPEPRVALGLDPQGDSQQQLLIMQAEVERLGSERDQLAMQVRDLHQRLDATLLELGQAQETPPVVPPSSLPPGDDSVMRQRISELELTEQELQEENSHIRRQRKFLGGVAGVALLVAILALAGMLTALLRIVPGGSDNVAQAEATQEAALEQTSPSVFAPEVAGSATSVSLGSETEPTVEPSLPLLEPTLTPTLEPTPELIPVLSGWSVMNGLESERQHSWPALYSGRLPITLELRGTDFAAVQNVSLYLQDNPSISLTLSIVTVNAEQIIAELARVPQDFTAGTYEIRLDGHTSRRYFDLNDYLRIATASGVLPEYLYSSDLYPAMDFGTRPKRTGEPFVLLYARPDRTTYEDWIVSVRRNDRLAILDDRQPEWYQVRVISNDGRNDRVGWVLRWVVGEGRPARPNPRAIQIPRDLLGIDYNLVKAELNARSVPLSAFLEDMQDRSRIGSVYDRYGANQVVSSAPTADGWWEPGTPLILGIRAP